MTLPGLPIDQEWDNIEKDIRNVILKEMNHDLADTSLIESQTVYKQPPTLEPPDKNKQIENDKNSATLDDTVPDTSSRGVQHTQKDTPISTFPPTWIPTKR